MHKSKRYLSAVLPVMLMLSLAVLVLTVFFGFFFQNKMVDEAYQQQLALLESYVDSWNTRYRAVQWTATHAETTDEIMAADNAVVSVSVMDQAATTMEDSKSDGMLSFSIEKSGGAVWAVQIQLEQMLPTTISGSRQFSVLTVDELQALLPQSQLKNEAQQLRSGGMLIVPEPHGATLFCVWPLAVEDLLLISMHNTAEFETAFSSLSGAMVTTALIVFVISALGSMLLTYRPFKALLRSNEFLAASDESARLQLARRILWEICTGARQLADAKELMACRSFPLSLLDQSTMLMFLTDETSGPDAPSAEDCSLRCKMLMQCIDTLLTSPHFLFSAPDGRRVVVLRTPLTQDEQGSLPQWKQDLEAQTFSFTLLCASFTTDKQGLAATFDRLRAAGHERFLSGMGQLHWVDSTLDEPAMPGLVSLQQQLEQLRGPLEKGNLEDGSSFIDLLNRYRTSYVDYQAALLQVQNFLSQERLLLKNTRRHTSVPDVLQIKHCRTSAEAEHLLDAYITELSACWAQIDKGRTDTYIHRIDALIEHHYADPRFGVTQIAEHLQITPTYAGKVYKDATGISPIDSLSAKRAAVAQQLLAETDIPLSEIYTLSGYSSNHYFYRVFRKRHSMTPMEYRKQAKSRYE